MKVDNIGVIHAAGADTFVAGSAIFGQPDYKAVIDRMRAELSAAKVIPYRIHLGIDALAGLLLLVSPWLFGFAEQIWWPHVIVGLAELGVVAMSWGNASRSAPI